MCVNDRVTCLQLMASVCGTCESYAEHVWKFWACLKFVDELGVLRHMPACFSVLLTYTKLTHNVFAKFFIRRHTLAKTSRCDRALKKVQFTLFYLEQHSALSNRTSQTTFHVQIKQHTGMYHVTSSLSLLKWKWSMAHHHFWHWINESTFGLLTFHWILYSINLLLA